MPVPDTKSSANKNRRHDIDWLRIAAVLLLIPFHTARIFDIWEPFYAKNAQTSALLSNAVIALLNPWHMPLLFVLAGASTWFALRFRSGRQYAGERFKRLLVPFLFGLAVVIPPQTYYALLTNRQYSGTFLEFYPSFFQVHPEDLSGYFGTFTPGHLWFVLFLFVYALLALPIFLALRGEAGQRRVAALARFFEKPGALFLLVIPLALCEALPDVGGKNVFGYFLLFVAGYVLVADERLQAAVDRQKGPALALGVVAMAAYFALRGWFEQFPDFSGPSILYALLRNLNTWAWVLALLGYGHRYLNVDSRLLRYAGEAAYPFYILHQTVIVIVGYYVVQWEAGIVVKFAVIAAGSLLGTLALYDLLVKRTAVTRFLFGMKPSTKALAQSNARAPETA